MHFMVRSGREGDWMLLEMQEDFLNEAQGVGLAQGMQYQGA
jgi:hypothetical protein